MILVDSSRECAAASSPHGAHHHLHASEDRARRCNDARHDDIILPAIEGWLSLVADELVIPVADRLDIGQAGDVGGRNDDWFGQHFGSRHEVTPRNMLSPLSGELARDRTAPSSADYGLSHYVQGNGFGSVNGRAIGYPKPNHSGAEA